MGLGLTRNEGEALIFHCPNVGLIRLKINRIDPGGRIRISIDAPDSVKIIREELLYRGKKDRDRLNSAAIVLDEAKD